MSLLELSLLAAACINVLIGLYALYVRPRRITTHALVLFAVGLGVWVGSFFLLLYTHNFFYDKVNHYAGLLFIGGLFLLALTFPDKKFRPEYLIAYLPFVIGVVFVMRGGVVTSDAFGPGDSVNPTQGPLFVFYAIGLLTYLLVSLIIFVRTYRALRGIERLRMKYLFLGIAIFVLPVCICDIGLPVIGFTYLNLVGPLASVGFVIATCYAVIRHQLMDIRVVIQRGTIYSLLISLIVGAYIILLLSISNLFDADMGIAAPLSASIVTIVGIVTIPRIERYFRRVTDKVFFKDRYDYASALEALSVTLNTHIRLFDLAPSLLDTLSSILRPNSLEFIHVATGTTFSSNSSHHFHLDSAPNVPLGGTRIAVSTRDSTIGLFTLGPKRSGDPYTVEDRRLLRTFASQAAVALEKTELYEQLRAYSDSLEEKVEERTRSITELQQKQRELFDDISHALQTPLTVLKGTLELQKTDSEKEAYSLTSMTASVDDLSMLINNMLRLARMNSLPEEEEFKALSLSELVENVIEYVEIICQQEKITVVKDIQAGLEILGNEKQLSEAVTNLLSNAVKYIGSGPVREIRVIVQTTGTVIEIHVSDTGIGIPQESLSDIFDRFYRAHKHGTGTGLGLAIVKRIVERHGGTIHAESALGKGTRFTISFPIALKAERLQSTDVLV
jgi:signal transduction histidine kinase